MKERNKLFFLLKFYLPLLVWLGAVYYLSSLSGTGEAYFNPLKTVLRKGFHCLEFSILAFILWRLMVVGHRISHGLSFWICLFFGVGLAFLDEFHQAWVVNRNGNLQDVLLDSLAVFWLLQLLKIFWLKKKKLAIFTWLFISLAIAVLVFKMSYQISFFDLNLALNFNQNKSQTEKSAPQEEKAEKESSPENQNKEELAQEKESSSPNSEAESEQTAADQTEEIDASMDTSTATSIDVANQPLPEKVLIKVPFTSQAPFANWDEVHEEACEEASLMMMNYFLKQDGRSNVDKQEAEDEIQKLKDFQIKNYGKFEDSTMAELKKLAEDFYQINNLEVVYDFKPEDLKRELAKNNPVILPTAGRKLNNPYYTPPGPLYHNLIAIGYDGDRIITNDPGTKRGKGLEYDLALIYEATHDFPGTKDEIEKGRKAMIVVR